MGEVTGVRMIQSFLLNNQVEVMSLMQEEGRQDNAFYFRSIVKRWLRHPASGGGEIQVGLQVGGSEKRCAGASDLDIFGYLCD